MTGGGGDSGLRETAVERRRHLRVEAALPVTFRFFGDDGDARCTAVTRDISHGGACLAVSGCTEDLLERLAGLPLLELAIDSVGPASFPSRIEWVRQSAEPGAPVLVGMEFHNLSDEEETVIIDLIAYILIGAREPAPPDIVKTTGCPQIRA